MKDIDGWLRTGRRGLRTRPGTLLLGPTGARLWVDFLDDRPGFAGAIDFIHKINIPLLFTVEHDLGALPVPSEVDWRPSHLRTLTRIGSVEIEETRFITWQDDAVSIQRWRNSGDTALSLRLAVDAGWITVKNGAGTGERSLAQGFGLRIHVRTSTPDLFRGVTLAPGEVLEFTVVAALGVAEQEDANALRTRATVTLQQPGPALLAKQVADYQSWFDKAPEFSSSSEILDRLWAYRWFLLRHSLARPGLAPLDGTFFYEGRSHKMTKAPWAPEGWEFSKLIPLSTPMHIIEARWHADADLATGVFPVLANAQGPDGQFHARTLMRELHPYANFMGWAVYQYALAKGAAGAVAAALPMLKRQVLGEDTFLATGGDSLPIQQRHQLTGKEYQPSYWYFHGFPDDPLDPATYTPLKRVDRAIYQYLNATGVAHLCRMTGDGEAAEFEHLAECLKGDILSKQWDDESGFFYDLHHETDEKAFVRNVVGFYPYWAGITGVRHLPGFLDALSGEFDTPNPLPSVSPLCPVFQPGGSWKGRFLKGRNGCMWDGPTWPYTNSIALDAIGRVTKSTSHAHDALFAHFFWKYALLHFQHRDGKAPYLVEHYDSMTGEPISDEPDYNHSYLIDLIVRHVAGLEIGEDGGLTVDPVDIGLDHFTLRNLTVAGREMEISYDAADGLRVFVDHAPAASRSDLGPLTVAAA